MMDGIPKSRILIIAIIGLILIFFLLAVFGVFTPKSNPSTNANLVIWGIDDANAAVPVFSQYMQQNPGIKISYRQFDPNQIKSQFINALAAGTGPDIVMIHNDWIPTQYDKLTPAPQGTISSSQIQQLFAPTASNDFILNYQGTDYIYALPLYLDSLALFYNKDILNNKGVALLPTTWDDFKILVPNLTETDLNHQIKKAGAAIGGSGKSILNASDLLTLLMMQNGSAIFNPQTNLANFSDQNGSNALNFYTQFANSNSPYYTWDDSLGSDLDLFGSGQVAMIFAYARQIPALQEKNPYLNFGVSVMPQLNPNQPVNFANYWGLAVSKQSANPQAAWNFIIWLTTDQTNSLSYLKAVNESPALRTLIAQYQNDPALGAFAKQALTAKTIYNMNDNFRQIFSNMIESVLSGKADVNTALSQAQGAMNP